MNFALALDLETTGTNPRAHQILEIGAVLMEARGGKILSEFRALVKHEELHGTAYALNMNSKSGLIMECEDGGITLGRAMAKFDDWLHEGSVTSLDKATPVGFNVGSFDVAFLKEAEVAYSTPTRRFSYRCLELGSAFHKGGVPQSSSTVLKEQLDIDKAPHRALEDARLAAQLYQILRIEGV